MVTRFKLTSLPYSDVKVTTSIRYWQLTGIVRVHNINYR